MAVYNRGRTVLWNNASTGANGKTKAGVVGAQTHCALFVQVGAATTIGIEVAPGNGTAGLNSLPVDADFYPLYKRDGSGALTITFGAAGKAAIDLSPLAAQFVRLTSTNDVTATAYMDVVG